MSRRARKRGKTTQSFSFLQSQRFRRLFGIGVVGMGLIGFAQIIAPVRTQAPLTLYIALEPAKRRAQAAEVASLFPAYTIWHWLTRAGTLRAGRYEIQPTETAMSVWNRLRRGLQTPLRLYLRPQRSAAHLAKFLSTHLAYDSTVWMASFLAYPWHTLGFSQDNWLALFLPDVYELYWTVSPTQLIQRMQENYKRFWNEERRTKAEAIGLTPIEVTILASIIEYETYRSSEKPLIASVYLNRLRLGMFLQADPTVIFATKQFQAPRVTQRMIEVESPYNTYKRRGLPPGPIGTPSLESIEAVLNYTPSEYLYFCARPDGSGYHDFSRDYKEHLTKARAYQRALNRWLAQRK
ncbi:MAG: endolytic transglycosylase MltG [Bacteroidia bacterium]|nr:endolytic transglycosylase MltG [Bacteroidia bacterium]MDW8016101.1 endolytic transglycosylase MltG [Bacteroidia bacterium]